MSRIKDKKNVMLYVIFVICIIYPMLLQGVMCNDEVMLRLWAQDGIINYFKTYVSTECISKGRILGTIGNLKFLQYIFQNIYIYRGICIFFILVAVTLFSYITYRFWNNKKFSSFLGIMILSFIPITFEHAVPNAFVIVSVQPMILIELSLVFYLNYLDKNEKRNLIWCLCLFLWSMCLYEFTIVYVLLFPMVYFIKNLEKEKIFIKTLKENIFIFICAFFYLLIYFIQGVIFPTNYSGNQFGKFSIVKMFSVLKTLFLSALPGYYTFLNGKYRTLFVTYNHGNVSAESIISPIIIIFVLIYIYILIKMYHEKKVAEMSDIKKVLIYLCTVLFAILPAVPNSLAKLYQGNVSSGFFTSLPVSIFLYFSIMLGICFLIWNIILDKRQYIVWGLIILVIVFSGTMNQVKNNVFAKEEFNNYNRFIATEEMFKMNFWSQYQGKRICAPSLYETRNTLAVEDGHWTNFLKIYNKEIEIENSVEADSDYIVQQTDNSYLVYIDKKTYLIISEQLEQQSEALKDINGNLNIYQINDLYLYDNNYYVYEIDFIK